MSNLPYQPRKPRSRPERALPVAPPPEEDVAAVNSFEQVQAMMSPPSPPLQSATPPSEPAAAPARPRPPVPKTPSLPKADSPSAAGADEANAGAQTSAAHLNPYHSTLPALTPPTILTPLRAHYLKKTLVNQQIAYELNLISHPVLGADSLGLLGDPFVLSDRAKHDAVSLGASRGDLPFMRYLFHQFLLPFPFLATASPTFWSAKVQPFLASFLSTVAAGSSNGLSESDREIARSLMTKEERKEEEDRLRLWAKVEKHLALMVGLGIKLESGEEVVRIGQAELRRLEQLQEERRKAAAQAQARRAGQAGGAQGSAGALPAPEAMAFDVNVVGVRVVTEKGRVRHKSHEEFIIRTSRTGVLDVFVSRRYGDFRRLAEELRIAFPDHELPNPPAKDKSAAAAPVAQPQQQYSYYNPLRAIYGNTPSGSGTTTPRTSEDAAGSAGSPSAPTSPLSREKNRLTLRAYLQAIIAQPAVLDSPVMRSFLLSSPTVLTPPEAADIQRRLEADAVREEGKRRFREEAERRVETLREGLAQFRGDVLSKDGGLRSVFEVVRRVENVSDLPPAERAVMEWGKISLAATIFQLYVASDTASETLAGLKRLHGLMPYFVLKGILKISNPMAMIRGVLDLFLARPFGGQSLIQRMFSSSLSEDVRLIAEDIQAVQDKIDDPVLCQKIDQYVNAPYEIQDVFRKDAASEGVDLLVVLLRSPTPPILSRPQIQRVARASRAYREYKLAQADAEDSDDDQGPDNDDAWLFEDLGILLKLMQRKKEKEALLALIFEGVTAELLKDIITIFYAPLAQVYKAASIADSLSDLQNFLNDMIRTVEAVEELSQENPQRTVQTFIDLVQRHEQAFYSFVHNVHSKGQGLFDSLMAWIELFLSYARDGLPHRLDLEVLLPHAEDERARIFKEVDDVAQYHYKLKVAHEEKIRRRFEGGQGQSQAGDEEELIRGVLGTLNLGGAVSEGQEVQEEESEEDDDADDGASDISSARSAPQRASANANANPNAPASPLPPPPNSAPAVTTFDSAVADGDATAVARRGSHSSHRSSMDKVRSSLDLKRRLHVGGGAKEQADKRASWGPDDAPPPPPPPPLPKDSPREPSQARKRHRRKARREQLLVPPGTHAIDELRPLFVEIVKELLVVKPLRQ
ncbi:hypothetical protein Q5752_002140 [Cryptotrichosporon argae]